MDAAVARVLHREHPVETPHEFVEHVGQPVAALRYAEVAVTEAIRREV